MGIRSWERFTCDAKEMDDSDSSVQVVRQAGSQPAQVANYPLEPMDPREVDEYMRHAARMLYDIIWDWLQEQPASRRHRKRKIKPETVPMIERSTE